MGIQRAPSPPPSPQPIDSLTSRVPSFDGHLRLQIAIAAKIASLHILDGRFQHHPDLTKEEQEDMGAVRDEQARLRVLQAATVASATKWLALLCAHLSVDLAALPDDPGDASGLGFEVPREQWFDVAWELVLLSLGVAAVPDTPSSKGKSPEPPPLDYAASSRALIYRTAGYLGLAGEIEAAEKTIAQTLYFQLQKAEMQDGGGAGAGAAWDEAATVKRQEASKKGKALKWAATGAGFVLGGVAIGLTGGLAAPALAPVLAGTLGLSFFGGAGGAVLIGTLLGLGGGGLAGYRTHNRLKGLDELSFEPIKPEDVPAIPSLSATVVVSGFLLDLRDSVDPWKPTFERSGLDVYALKADPKAFLDAGRALDKWVRNKALQMGGTELLKLSALSALYAGVALPLTVFQGVATALDSDFSRCRDKAKKAGLLLADILQKKIQGHRPCTLIGYGPGATVVFEALLTLNRQQMGDLVHSAVLISLPNSPSAINWAAARSVVTHRLVNCFSSNDWVLAINSRLYSLSASVAGLQAVKHPGVENIDVSDLVGGHLEIRGVVAQILARVDNSNVSVAT